MSTKKIILLIFSLGIHSAYAGMMRPACGLSDTAPCDTSAWEFGANALYLEETYANQPWKTEQSIINTLTGNQEAPVSLKGYGWGFFCRRSLPYRK